MALLMVMVTMVIAAITIVLTVEPVGPLLTRILFKR